MKSLVISYLSFNINHCRPFLVMENRKWKMESTTDGVCA